MPLTLLHTNDLHGMLTPELCERLRPLRDRADLYFDSGDCIKAGNLAVPLRPERAWEALRALRCTAGTLGNRETHVLESAFRAKLEGAAHPLLCANLIAKREGGSLPVRRDPLTLEAQGVRLGVFGVMVPMVTARMKTQAVSAFLWENPVDAAKRCVQLLKGEVDAIVALTHLGMRHDRALAEACPEIDLILGGHSHTRIDPPERVGGTWICQGGSHGRFAGLYTWEPGEGRLEGAPIPL